MKREMTVAFAVVASLLVVSATPATAASAELAVGSEHNDFGTDDESAPATLENLEIVGAGSTAYLAPPETRAVDDFEDNDLDEYADTVDKSAFNTQTSAVNEGSYALYGETESDGSPNAIISQTGLPNYPQRGDTFTVDFNFPLGESKMGILIGGESGTALHNYTGYMVWAHNNNAIGISKFDNGTETVLDSKNVTNFDPDTWYTLTVEFGKSSITIEDSNNNNPLTVTDTSYTGSNLGFVAEYIGGSTSGGGAYFDNVTITERSESQYLSANHTVSNAHQRDILRQVASQRLVRQDRGEPDRGTAR